MKRRFAPLLIALLTCGVLMATGCNRAQKQAQPPAQLHKCVGRIEIGEYGTLKCLRNADGKYFDGKTLGEGYAVGYQYQESAKSKPVEGFIYALDDEHSDNLEAEREGQALTDENSVKAIVKTKDQALKIIHEIAVDDKSGLVEIRRTIQALDKLGVQVSLVKLQTSSLLAGGKQITASSSAKDLIPGIVMAGVFCHPCECQTIPPIKSTESGRAYCPGDPPCTSPECCPDPPLPPPAPPCPSKRGPWQFEGSVKSLDQASRYLKEKIKSQTAALQLPVGADYANINQWTPLSSSAPIQLNDGRVTIIIERIRLPH